MSKFYKQNTQTPKLQLENTLYHCLLYEILLQCEPNKAIQGVKRKSNEPQEDVNNISGSYRNQFSQMEEEQQEKQNNSY